MRQIEIGGVIETVIERADYPPARLSQVLGNEMIAVLGYGTQGRGQSLNLRDSGARVIVGQRRGKSYDEAVRDGWEPGESLFELEEAARRGTIIMYLLSDAGQKEQWPKLKPWLTSGKALCLAHGFSIVFADQTGVVPPSDIDVFLVAPKGSGTTLRRNFLDGHGLNSSYSVYHDATGRARDRCLSIGFSIGSAYLFETSMRNEVYADLTGERGVLLGAIYGLWLAQYEVLRAHGHSPAEAFHETVEEATQSLYPLIAENGMDWMYANASTTAQRGALDWYRRFCDVNKPLFEELYRSVQTGAETARALAANSQPDYREKLARELAAIAESEMWKAGKIVRSFRPSANG